MVNRHLKSLHSWGVRFLRGAGFTLELALVSWVSLLVLGALFADAPVFHQLFQPDPWGFAMGRPLYWQVVSGLLACLWLPLACLAISVAILLHGEGIGDLLGPALLLLAGFAALFFLVGRRHRPVYRMLCHVVWLLMLVVSSFIFALISG